MKKSNVKPASAQPLLQRIEAAERCLEAQKREIDDLKNSISKIMYVCLEILHPQGHNGHKQG